MNCDHPEIPTAATTSTSQTLQQRQQHLWPTRRRHAEFLKPRPPRPGGRGLLERKGQRVKGRPRTAKVTALFPKSPTSRHLLVIFYACHDLRAVELAASFDAVLLTDLSSRLRTAKVTALVTESAARRRRFTTFQDSGSLRTVPHTVLFLIVLLAHASPGLKNAKVATLVPGSAARCRPFTTFEDGHGLRILQRAVLFDDVFPADASVIGRVKLQTNSLGGESLWRHSSRSEDSSFLLITPEAQGGAPLFLVVTPTGSLILLSTKRRKFARYKTRTEDSTSTSCLPRLSAPFAPFCGKCFTA
ncbi:hypothetical protein HPB50_025053 [Hyalomma asiaticum]|uniref:Uncharacterized protein n=1 Tax=Hyalomma asiaticum TaxID=266040 RepID=A0ACB7TBN8_HYAAI|nr:hypothetical protein HPB50_025053 [Hyalomma asiaticum]